MQCLDVFNRRKNEINPAIKHFCIGSNGRDCIYLNNFGISRNHESYSAIKRVIWRRKADIWKCKQKSAGGK